MNKPMEKMTVAELKAELKARGLPDKVRMGHERWGRCAEGRQAVVGSAPAAAAGHGSATARVLHRGLRPPATPAGIGPTHRASRRN